MIPLLKHFIRVTMPVTIVATLIALIYCCVVQELFESCTFGVFGFVTAHCAVLVYRVGRPNSPEEVFVYARGHSRDAIWAAKVLASLVSVLAVCGAVAVMTNLGLRSLVQDRVFEGPNFPVFAQFERLFAFHVILIYFYIISVMHYAWVRWSLPMKKQNLLFMVVVGVLSPTLVSVVKNSYNSPGWVLPTFIGVGMSIAMFLFVIGRALHQSVGMKS